MKKIDLMIASIIDGRENYERAFEAAVKKAEKRKQEAHASFIKDRLKQELEEIEAEKETAIENARADALAKVSAWAGAIRDEERKAVSLGSFDARSFEELEAIGRLPVTSEEFTALCLRYEKGGYWAKKILGQIAMKNGLPYSVGMTIDEKLGIVRNLMNGFADYLEVYNGHGQSDMTDERTARAFATVSNSVLRRLAEQYTSTDQFGTLQDEQCVKAMYDSIRVSDAFDGGMKLRNFMKSSPDNVKNLLLLKLIGDSNVDGRIFKLANINADEIRVNYNERLEQYKAAGDALEGLKQQAEQLKNYKATRQDSYAVDVFQKMGTKMQRLLDADTNGYLAGMIISEAKSNTEIRETAEEIGIMEPEQEPDQGESK